MFNKCDSSCESRISFFSLSFCFLLVCLFDLFLSSVFRFDLENDEKTMKKRKGEKKNTKSNEKWWRRQTIERPRQCMCVCRVEKERRRDLIKTASFFVMLHEDVLLTDHFSQSGFHCAGVFFLSLQKRLWQLLWKYSNEQFLFIRPDTLLAPCRCFHSRSLIPNHLLECNATTWTRARPHTIHFLSLFVFFFLRYGDNRRNTLRFSPTAKLHKGMIALKHTHKERKKSF